LNFACFKMTNHAVISLNFNGRTRYCKKKNVKQGEQNVIKTMYLQNICDTTLLRQIFSKDCLNGDQTRRLPTYNNIKQTSTIKRELKHLLNMVTNKYVMKHIIHSYTTLHISIY